MIKENIISSDNYEQTTFIFEDNKPDIKKQTSKVDSIKQKNTENKLEYYSNRNELPILNLYNNLLLYVYKIFNKIKTHQVLIDSILSELSFCHKQLFMAKTIKDRKTKYKYLILVEANLNYLNASMRNVRKLRLITPKNYTVWSYKITEFDKSLRKWMNACRRS